MTHLRFLVIGPGPTATYTVHLVIGPAPTLTVVTKGRAVPGFTRGTTCNTRILAAGARSTSVARLLVIGTGPQVASRLVVTGPGPSVSCAKQQRGIWHGRLCSTRRTNMRVNGWMHVCARACACAWRYGRMYA